LSAKNKPWVTGLIYYYSGEMGGGFHPRVIKIIDEIIWYDEYESVSENSTTEVNDAYTSITYTGERNEKEEKST
jgi:hypothetical protein